MALNNIFIYDLFCDGMKDVMSTCTWILTKCFGRKDMIEKRNRYMRLLQSVSSLENIFDHNFKYLITDFHGHYESRLWWSHYWNVSMQTFSWCWIPEVIIELVSSPKQMDGCHHYFGSPNLDNAMPISTNKAICIKSIYCYYLTFNSFSFTWRLAMS